MERQRLTSEIRDLAVPDGVVVEAIEQFVYEIRTLASVEQRGPTRLLDVGRRTPYG